MRFLALFLFVILTFGAVLAQHDDTNADYYIMSDYELSLDPYSDFDVMGGEAMLHNLPTTLPVQSKTLPVEQRQPITLPIQQATRELITLPVQTSKAQAVQLQPVVNQKVISQPITRYQYIEQPIIQPRLIEQPKLQQRIVTQPVYRQIVTQPVIVPRVTTQPIIQQRLIEQPIIQHRLIENTVVQPQLVEVPVTNKAQMQQAIQMDAQPIIQRQATVHAQPILRQAPTLTQAPVTAPMQSSKHAQYGSLGAGALSGSFSQLSPSASLGQGSLSQAALMSGAFGGEQPSLAGGDMGDMPQMGMFQGAPQGGFSR